MSLAGILGTLTLETRRSGLVTARRVCHNLVCTAGLNDLAAAVAYAAVQDVATQIGTSTAYMAPLWGAVGVGTNPPYSVTGTTTAGSWTVSSVSSTAGISVGMGIVGSGIPPGAYVEAIGSGTLTISQAATASASGVALSIGTESSDIALYQEYARTTVSSSASAPASGSTGSVALWQFQFSTQATAVTVTETGLFTFASADTDSGDLLDHALVSPALAWPVGETLTLSAQLQFVSGVSG